MTRSGVCFKLVLLALLACAGAARASDDPTIAAQIARLGDADVAARDRATLELWKAGRLAEGALRAALNSDDPEIAGRAKTLLMRLDLGIDPGTPREIFDLVEQYRSGEGDERRYAIGGLSNAGTRGLRVLLGLAHQAGDDGWRNALLRAVGARPHEREGAALMLSDADPAVAGEILRSAADGSDSGARDWAAFKLMQGGLDEQINAARDAAKEGSDSRAATRLTYLARARGDLVLAALAADLTDDPGLVDSVLIEAGDWRRLSVRYRDRVANSSETLGFTAAFCRLAGEAGGLEDAAAALRSFADHHEEEYANCAKCLMFNDRVDDAIAVLLAHKDYLAALDYLIPRLQFKQAIELAGKASDLKPAMALRLRARAISAYWFTGDRAAAENLLREVAAENEKLGDVTTWIALADAARQLGAARQADHFLESAMERAETTDGPTQPNTAAVLENLNLPENFRALFWWRILRTQHASQSAGALMKELVSFARGKQSAAETDALVEAARTAAESFSAEGRAYSFTSIGSTLDLLGRHEAAERWYRACEDLNHSPESLRMIGDCQAARGDFSHAAMTYSQAWDLERPNPVPLALRGWALLKCGDVKPARQLIDLSHALPLGDETQRTALEEIFRTRDLPDDARRERDLILKTGPFLSWEVCNANRLNADDQSARGDFLGAADSWERAFLRNLRSSSASASAWGNVMAPVLIHKTRALGLMKQSPAAALAEAQLAMRDAPGDADTLIELVTAFEKAGDKTQADALFAESSRAYSCFCEQFPASGPAHNLLAWIEARCRHNLDDAIKNAKRAVELEPHNAASVDTLAEVYFQRGEFAEAIAAMKTCIDLEPDVAEHRARLQRFEAAIGKR